MTTYNEIRAEFIIPNMARDIKKPTDTIQEASGYSEFIPNPKCCNKVKNTKPKYGS